MRHARNPMPVEEGRIPPEVRLEAMASKSRVRARIEEIAARIGNQESGPSNDVPAETPSESAADFNEEITSITALE